MAMEAWVTLATNDTYALGCLVLGQSLRRTETTRQLHCMVTPGVTDGMRGHLSQVFDTIQVVDVLDSGDEENLTLISRPELGITFTKLHCWRLTQYRKCVFLDADTLILSNSDELFDREEFSAAPDIGWPDIFNSGVFVFRPSSETYRALLQFALTHGSFDGGDQGLLNEYFSDWREKDASFRLPFTYNMSSNAIYTYTAAYKRFSKEIKIVHFLGTVKPWHHSCSPTGGLSFRQDSQHDYSHVAQWWTIFTQDIQTLLQPQYSVPFMSHCCLHRTCKHDFRTPLQDPRQTVVRITPGQPAVCQASQSAMVKFDTTVVEYTRSDTHAAALAPVTASSLTGRVVSAKRSRADQNEYPVVQKDSSTDLAAQPVPLQLQPTNGSMPPGAHSPTPESSDEVEAHFAKPVKIQTPVLQRIYRVELKPLADIPEIPSCVKYGYATEAGAEHKKIRYGKASQEAESPRFVAQIGPKFDEEEKSPTPVAQASVTVSVKRRYARPPRTPVPQKAHVVVEEKPAIVATDACPASSADNLNLASVGGITEGGPTGDLAGPGAPPSGQVPAASAELAHKRAWEAGQVDYLGRDSWENIQKRLDQTLGIS